jgi:hypothetical protein
MGGGLLQLVAYGAQDVYLTGNPQITFFKTVYRRHTNFSIESIKQTFNGTADFGNEVSTTIQRNADLIGKIYLETTLPEINVSDAISTTDNTTYKAFRWLNWIGHVMLKSAEIRIGGQKIDKHYGEWLHLWNELSQDEGKKSGYAELLGNVPKLTQIYSSNTRSSENNGKDCKVDAYDLTIPLQFWFCRNPGMSLPLIALQYTDIVLNLEFRTFDECIWATTQTTTSTNQFVTSTGVNSIGSKSLSSTNIYVDYIYLDTEERRRFAQVAHEYLIEQLQFTGEENITATSNSIKINFTHPVKELVWVIQPSNFVQKDYSQSRGGRQYYNYTDLWDYSSFTGTPDPYSGHGMVGGKGSNNFLYTLNNVNVNGELNTNNGWSNSLVSSDLNKSNAGYNDISNYTKLNDVSTINNRTGLWSLNGGKLLDSGKNPIVTAKLVLNGNDRFTERKGKYFNIVQPLQHHSNCPAPGINVYSFAITPEDHQPSGTCNFSRIDNAHLSITVTDNTISSIYNSGNAKIRIYSVNYNILRIMSGMAGLAYSN